MSLLQNINAKNNVMIALNFVGYIIICASENNNNQK